MCKKILNQEYLSAATTKTAMAAATGREINKVQAFTLIVSKQSGKNHREDLIQANVPVKIWAEVTNQSSFAIRPIIKEPGKKALHRPALRRHFIQPFLFFFKSPHAQNSL